jgi:flavorubredoxin
MVDILKENGFAKVAFTDLTRDDMAEAIEDSFRYSRLIVAAASYDGGVFPPMEDFINRLSHKAYQNRKVGIIENGSWAPTAGKWMKTAFEGMKNITICGDTVTIKSTMKDEDIANMTKLAEAIK